MRVSHECTAPVTPQSAVDRLQAFIAGRRSSKEPCGDMEGFERELHGYVMAVEREVWPRSWPVWMWTCRP
jgi:hypothetical protein